MNAQRLILYRGLNMIPLDLESFTEVSNFNILI